jgi:hypothetical protein
MAAPTKTAGRVAERSSNKKLNQGVPTGEIPEPQRDCPYNVLRMLLGDGRSEPTTRDLVRIRTQFLLLRTKVSTYIGAGKVPRKAAIKWWRHAMQYRLKFIDSFERRSAF